MSTPGDGTTRRAPRGPASVQLVLVVVLAVVVAMLSLTVHQQPPPAIAEFAPQAVKQIKQAPPDQASKFGSGPGSGHCAGGGCSPGPTKATPAPAATPTPPAKPLPRQKRCVGDRQTEDPQSPPCVSYWDSRPGNGGATSFGVTADSITIGIPVTDIRGYDDTDQQYEAYAAYFNDRYMFYGRKIRFVNYSIDGSSAATEQAGADLARQNKVFISTQEHGLTSYYAALARYHIMGVYRTPDYSDGQLADRAPYLWGYDMSATQIMTHLGSYVCKRLVGGNAEHAGMRDSTDMRTERRKFAIVLEQLGANNQLRAAPLKAQLQACGASVPYTIEVPYSTGQSITQSTQQVLDMKNAGVNSVICLCEEGDRATYYWGPASSQRWFPEWVTTNYPQLNEYALHTYNVTAQSDHMFGVAFQPMERNPADHPSVWALQEGGSTLTNTGLAVQTHDITYRALLLIASGIQMAGPKLTPKTFAAGLHRIRFPNPRHPIQAGDVGFQDGDYSMTDDGAEFWWSNSASSPYPGESEGALCWVRGGQHFGDDAWLRTSRLFTGTCDNGSRSLS